MTNLQQVSLFSGIGGFDLAGERNGIQSLAACEIDEHARATFLKHFPNTHMFTDVREVTRDALLNIGAEPTRTLLTGGFPCQDLSGAGRRAGLAGPRSGLFYEVARIIDEFGPSFVLLENVCGLLSSAGGRDMGSVIGTLEELRYKWAYRVLDSKFYGVAQQRRRVFIAAVPRESRISPEQVLAIR